MIVSHRHKFCILEKPKCGTTAIRDLLSKPEHQKKLGKAFINKHTIHSCHYDYYNYNYRHVNLNGAVHYLLHNGIMPESYTFVCVIREPIALFKSLYFFDLNRQNKYHIYNLPETLRKTPHYFQFTDAVFFQNYKDFNIKFFQLSEINKFEEFLAQYDITEPLKHINENKNKGDLNIDESLSNKIKQDFFIYDTVFADSATRAIDTYDKQDQCLTNHTQN